MPLFDLYYELEYLVDLRIFYSYLIFLMIHYLMIIFFCLLITNFSFIIIEQQTYQVDG